MWYGKRGNRSDRGAAVLEYAVLILLIALVAVAIAAVSLGSRLGERLEWAVCTALNLGEECSIEDITEEIGLDDLHEDPDEFVPDLCERGSMYEAESFQVGAGLLFESESTVQRIERSDGSVWYVAQPNNRSVGVGLGYGANVAGGESFNVNAGIEGDATYDSGEGEIWVFDEDERAEADAFEEQLQEETPNNAGAHLWDEVRGATWDQMPWVDDEPDLPESDMELDVWGGSAEIEGGVSTGINIDETPATEGGPQMDLGLGVDLEGSGAYENITRVDDREDETIISETHQVHGSIGGNGDIVLGAGPSGDLGWTSGVREDRTEDGELQGILLSAEYDQNLSMEYDMPFGLSSGDIAGLGPDVGVDTDIDHSVQQTYVYLQFDDDDEREIGEEFLEDYGSATGSAQYFMDTIRDDHGYANEDPNEDGSWEQLVYDNAEVWQTEHDREHTDAEYGASARWKVFTVGGSGGSEEYEQDTTDAWYLDAPEDGTRDHVTHEDCINDD